MRRMRFSIAGLMGFVVVAAVGFAGLKNADELWAGGCFTLMFVGLVVSILNAVQGRGRGRAFWTGFAIAGWAYVLASGFAMDSSSPSPPITGPLFDLLAAVIHPDDSKYTTLNTAVPTMVTPPPRRSVLRLPPQWPSQGRPRQSPWPQRRSRPPT